ncbi:helix-turn-helix transcriptional regulator [Microbacterium halotolerans]|uniref:helix-turn-helix transcriptional regulator n=1 Tax=Microbacterium halotolerans TaxID=246613 RepID=UPI0013C30C05|nr:response regulator transcription factor [Microbacterium halotolerans]
MNTHAVLSARASPRSERIDPRKLRRIAVVDASTLQRRGIAQALNRPPYRRVTHTAASVDVFLAQVEYDHRWPHLLVVAFPPRPAPSEVLAAAAPAVRSRLRVLAVTAGRTDSDVRSVLEAEFDGVIAAQDSEHELRQIVDAALHGVTTVSASIRALIDAPSERPRLSMQEERVLTHYAAGMTISQTAAMIGVRHDTARKYLSRVKAKYAAAGFVARTRLDLSRLARRDGYVSLDLSN